MNNKPEEEYSFNIESVLFPLLTLEQQKLWKKEIEMAFRAGMAIFKAKIQRRMEFNMKYNAHIRAVEDKEILSIIDTPPNEKVHTAHCFGFQAHHAYFSFTLPSEKYLIGSEVKVIVLKD